jgi:hypothetical protein
MYIKKMIKLPHISAVLEKKFPGKVVLSFNGQILAIAENSYEALQMAKNKMPNIDQKEFLISRIHYPALVA